MARPIQRLNQDLSSGAPPATIKQDAHTLNADTRQRALTERAFASDAITDTAP